MSTERAPLPRLLLERAGALTGRLLGIVGPPGAGKSTLAAQLAAEVAGAVVVPMDGFHLPTARLVELGRAERRGAPDTFDAAGYIALLRAIRVAGTVVRAPDFDRTLEEPIPAAIEVAPAAPLVITEGNYLLLDEPPWSGIGVLLDEVWYVEVPERLRVERLVDRFVRFGMDATRAAERVLRGSDADNAGLVAATRPRADLVIRPEGWPHE